MHGCALSRIRRFVTVRRGFAVILPAALVFWVAELWLSGWPCTLPQALALPGQRLVSPPYEALVQAGEPSVIHVAGQLRVIEPDGARRALLIPRALRGLIWYRRDLDTFGQLDIAVTPAEMQALKASRGWLAMQGDCDDYAVYGASIAAALEIPYRFNAAARHAWVEVQVGGQWRSIFANDHRGAAPAIEAWEPAEGPVGFERQLKADAARAASVRWLCDLPVDPGRGNVPPRLRLEFVHGIAGVLALAAACLLNRCHVQSRRRQDAGRRCDRPERLAAELA